MSAWSFSLAQRLSKLWFSKLDHAWMLDHQAGPWKKGHLPWSDIMVHGVHRPLMKEFSAMIREKRQWVANEPADRGMRNNRLKFETAGNLPIVSEEFIEYTPISERKIGGSQHGTSWTCKTLGFQPIMPKTLPRPSTDSQLQPPQFTRSQQVAHVHSISPHACQGLRLLRHIKLEAFWHANIQEASQQLFALPFAVHQRQRSCTASRKLLNRPIHPSYRVHFGWLESRPNCLDLFVKSSSYVAEY